jgi:type II secretory pathway component PulM
MSLWERIGGVVILFEMGGGAKMRVKMGLMYMGVLKVVVVMYQWTWDPSLLTNRNGGACVLLEMGGVARLLMIDYF